MCAQPAAPGEELEKQEKQEKRWEMGEAKVVEDNFAAAAIFDKFLFSKDAAGAGTGRGGGE